MYLDEIGHFSHFLLYVAIRIEINKMAVCLSVLGLHSDLCRWAVKQNKFTLLYLVVPCWNGGNGTYYVDVR